MKLQVLLFMLGAGIAQSEPAGATDLVPRSGSAAQESLRLKNDEPETTVKISVLPSSFEQTIKDIQPREDIKADGLMVDDSPQPQVVLIDKEAGRIYYVEGNGRKLVCLSLNDGLVWAADPLLDWALKPYRLQNPRISRLRFVMDKRTVKQIEVKYSNSQFGVIRTSDGKGYCAGQD